MGSILDLCDFKEFQELWKDCNKPASFKICTTFDECTVGFKDGPHGSNSFFMALLRYTLLHIPKGKFLDLGFGNGESTIYGAKEGWQAYGIDFCINCYHVSERAVALAQSLSYIPRSSVRIAYGNFFPRDFELERFSCKEEDPCKRELEKHSVRFCGSDPYSQLDLRLEDVDLYYHYQIERKNNLFRLFSRYAKPDARFLFIKNFRDSFVMPDDVFIEEESNEAYLLRKKS